VADEVKPPVAIRITRPYAGEDEYLEREFDTITRTSVVLVGAQSRPQGVILRFEVVLTSGVSVLRGEGRVVAFKPSAYGGEPGLTLRFTRLDSKSKALVDRAAALREARIRAGTPQNQGMRGNPPPVPGSTLDGPPASPSFLAPSAFRSSDPPPPPQAAPRPPSSQPPPLPRSASMRPRPTPPPLPPQPAPSAYDSATFASSPFPDPAVDPFPQHEASSVTDIDLESTQVDPLAMAMRDVRAARSEPPPPPAPPSSRGGPIDFESAMRDLSPLSAPMHMPSAPPPPSARPPSFPPPSRSYPLPAPSVPPPAPEVEVLELAPTLDEPRIAEEAPVARQPFLPAPESDPYAVDVDMDRVELHDDLIAGPPPPPPHYESPAEPIVASQPAQVDDDAYVAPARESVPLPVAVVQARTSAAPAPAPAAPRAPSPEHSATVARNGASVARGPAAGAPADRDALLERLRGRGRALAPGRIAEILTKPGA
jgi:hypothetical protein